MPSSRALTQAGAPRGPGSSRAPRWGRPSAPRPARDTRPEMRTGTGAHFPFPVLAWRFRVALWVPLEAAGRELRGGRRFPSSCSSSSSSSSSSWCRWWLQRAVPGERGRAGRAAPAGRVPAGGEGEAAGPGAAPPARSHPLPV